MLGPLALKREKQMKTWFFLLLFVLGSAQAALGAPTQAGKDEVRPAESDDEAAAKLQAALRAEPLLHDVDVSIRRDEDCGGLYHVTGNGLNQVMSMCSWDLILSMRSDAFPSGDIVSPFPPHTVFAKAVLTGMVFPGGGPNHSPYNIVNLLTRDLYEAKIPLLTLRQLSLSSMCPELRQAATLLTLLSSIEQASAPAQSTPDASATSYTNDLQKSLDANNLQIKVRADGNLLVAGFKDTLIADKVATIFDPMFSAAFKHLCQAGFVTFLPMTESAFNRKVRKGTNAPPLIAYLITCRN
jgi:hypothetical protein